MNIFALHPDPAIAASYHCDQHLHKMILESAQMLSTVARIWHPNLIKSLYLPTHPNHPCTLWIRERGAALWLSTLAKELDLIRLNIGCNRHKSMDVIDLVHSYIEDEDNKYTPPFVFCGPERIRIRQDLNIYEKYQHYYKIKAREWLDKGRQMTYKGRPIPGFMQETLKQS